MRCDYIQQGVKWVRKKQDDNLTSDKFYHLQNEVTRYTRAHNLLKNCHHVCGCLGKKKKTPKRKISALEHREGIPMCSCRKWGSYTLIEHRLFTPRRLEYRINLFKNKKKRSKLPVAVRVAGWYNCNTGTVAFITWNKIKTKKKLSKRISYTNKNISYLREYNREITRTYKILPRSVLNHYENMIL